MAARNTLDQGATPEDTRFQFEVIKNLGESVRALADRIQQQSDHMHEALLRLERIEAKETAEVVARLEKRLAVLEADKHKRDGAQGVLAGIFKSPVLAWIMGAIGVIIVYFEGKS